jgi:class 3 adenylate cyclase
MERKLTAILSADVEGYSRLMGEDEEATIRTLTAYREVMTTLIQQHRGRVVDSPGDNLLAEFASAVDAVQGALAIQRELKTRNAELPANRQMAYRIGINVDDVVVEGERVYGDGVNIAARLESLAEGGGICISGTVYDQVENKLALQYDYLGEQAVKNISKPVRVYKVLLVPGAVAHRVIQAKRAVARIWGKAALALAAVVVVGVLVSNFYWVPSRRPLVVMMDSPNPAYVYDQVIQEASGTNADAINDILADLPIDRQKEAVGPRWHRDQEILQFDPDLIIIHYSAFGRGKGYTRMKTFLSYFVGNKTKFLIYSRRPELLLQSQVEELLSDLEAEHPGFLSRIEVFGVRDHGPPEWLDSITASEFKLVVKEELGLK